MEVPPTSPPPPRDELFAKNVERNFGIESHLFRKLHFDQINKFLEAHPYYFTPLDSLHDNVTDTHNNRDLVADVDPDALIRIVRSELKNGKAPCIGVVGAILMVFRIFSFTQTVLFHTSLLNNTHLCK